MVQNHLRNKDKELGNPDTWRMRMSNQICALTDSSRLRTLFTSNITQGIQFKKPYNQKMYSNLWSQVKLNCCRSLLERLLVEETCLTFKIKNQNMLECSKTISQDLLDVGYLSVIFTLSAVCQILTGQSLFIYQDDVMFSYQISSLSGLPCLQCLFQDFDPL